MSKIPDGFFSRKSFKTLPELAFMTWLAVFIMDAVILQRLQSLFLRTYCVWILGLVFSFLLELARYRNLNWSEKEDYRNYFMVLNAFLIFLYASSYTGLTTTIGSWGELQAANGEKRAYAVPATAMPGEAVILASAEWAIPVLARQTSYFPDIHLLAEVEALKSQNSGLLAELHKTESGTTGNNDLPGNTGISELQKQLEACRKALAVQKSPAANSAGESKSNDDGFTRAGEEISRLKNDSTALAENNQAIQSSLDMLRDTCGKLSVAMDSLARENASLGEGMGAADQKYASLAGSIADLNAQLSRLLVLRQNQCIANGEDRAFKMLLEMCGPNVPEVEEYKQLVYALRPVKIP